MTRITTTKLSRAQFRVGKKWGEKELKDKSFIKTWIPVLRVTGYKEAQPRVWVNSPIRDGKKALISGGQVINWKKLK